MNGVGEISKQSRRRIYWENSPGQLVQEGVWANQNEGEGIEVKRRP